MKFFLWPALHSRAAWEYTLSCMKGFNNSCSQTGLTGQVGACSFIKDNDLSLQYDAAATYGTRAEKKIRYQGMWKPNLESTNSSESKKSKEFLKGMSLEKWVVAQIQHNGQNHFDKSSSASCKCITPATGSLEHFYEEPSPLLYFSGQKRRKRAWT